MLQKILSFLPIILLILSCRETGTTPNPDDFADVIFTPDTSDSGRIFIRDYTGKEWDVTHAVNEYGFKAERFQFGLGPFAIRPILDPEFISSEDPEFIQINENELVIGTVINGEARAYPLYSLEPEKRNSILILTRYLVFYKNSDKTCNIIIFPDPYFSLVWPVTALLG